MGGSAQITDEATGLPYGIPDSNPQCVTSPYPPGILIHVGGATPGTVWTDISTNKKFVIPERNSPD